MNIEFLTIYNATIGLSLDILLFFIPIVYIFDIRHKLLRFVVIYVICFIITNVLPINIFQFPAFFLTLTLLSGLKINRYYLTLIPFIIFFFLDCLSDFTMMNLIVFIVYTTTFKLCLIVINFMIILKLLKLKNIVKLQLFSGISFYILLIMSILYLFEVIKLL